MGLKEILQLLVKKEAKNEGSVSGDNLKLNNMGTLLSICFVFIMAFYLLFSEQLSKTYRVESQIKWINMIGIEGILLLSIFILFFLAIIGHFLGEIGVPSKITKIFIAACYIYPIKQILECVRTLYYYIEVERKDVVDLRVFLHPIKIRRIWDQEEYSQAYDRILDVIRREKLSSLADDSKDLEYLSKIFLKYSDKEIILSRVNQLSDIEPLIVESYKAKLDNLKLQDVVMETTSSRSFLEDVVSIINVGIDYRWYILSGICIVGVVWGIKSIFLSNDISLVTASTLSKSVEQQVKTTNILSSTLESTSNISKTGGRLSNLVRETNVLVGTLGNNVVSSGTQIVEHVTKSNTEINNSLTNVVTDLALVKEGLNTANKLLMALFYLLITGNIPESGNIPNNFNMFNSDQGVAFSGGLKLIFEQLKSLGEFLGVKNFPGSGNQLGK
ncbi:MAG: hypothetical protein ACXVHS_00910 [Methanobacterium sp.]